MPVMDPRDNQPLQGQEQRTGFRPAASRACAAVVTYFIICEECRDESSIPTPAELGTSTSPSVASIHERWLCGAGASLRTLRISLISSFSSVIECSIGSSTAMVTR
ncbi:ribonuclease HI [Trypanosoma cruzi]|nr:ribonuclease HI [Trypanosoma cruzi]